MKTNVQWYMELPEPYKMHAIQNAERDNLLGMKASTLAAALCAFPWGTTPQGYDYWQEVFAKAKSGEIEKGAGELKWAPLS
jgi:hypothetical protein